MPVILLSFLPSVISIFDHTIFKIYEMKGIAEKLRVVASLFNTKTIKGRFVWMAVFFLIILLIYSSVMMVQNSRVGYTIDQMLDVRMGLREDLEHVALQTRDLLSQSRNDILKRRAFRNDESGNYPAFRDVNLHIQSVNALQEHFSDSLTDYFFRLDDAHKQLNRDFKRADSIWENNRDYYQQFNVRENLTDPHTLVYRQYLSDTLKVISIEAEDAYYAGPFINYSYQGFSGHGYADFVNTTDDFLEFRFQSKEAATHQFFLLYSNAEGNRALSILLDDQPLVEELSSGGRKRKLGSLAGI